MVRSWTKGKKDKKRYWYATAGWGSRSYKTAKMRDKYQRRFRKKYGKKYKIYKYSG